jgi:hypothetical protein
MLLNTMIGVESYHLLHSDILEKSFVQVLNGCRQFVWHYVWLIPYNEHSRFTVYWLSCQQCPVLVYIFLS